MAGEQNQKAPQIKFMGLWEKKDKNGNMFLTGSLGGNRVSIFRNRYKSEDKHPDWIAYLSPIVRNQGGQGSGEGGSNNSGDDFGFPDFPPSFGSDEIPF